MAELVSEIMDRDPVTVSPETSVQDVVAALRENELPGVPVVESDGTVVGIVTERDLVRSLGAGEDPDSELVGDHLTSRATFADGDWGLEDAADAMARGGFRHLVVVSNGEVEGIISMRDIMHVWRPQS